jgi:hypothetical protein
MRQSCQIERQLTTNLKSLNGLLLHFMKMQQGIIIYVSQIDIHSEDKVQNSKA